MQLMLREMGERARDDTPPEGEHLGLIGLCGGYRRGSSHILLVSQYLALMMLKHMGVFSPLQSTCLISLSR